MRKRILFLIFVTVFLKELVWIAVVPLWHFPDEQAHFGQAAYIAEKGSQVPYPPENDLTEEILIYEKTLGTKRDKFGNNKFTFHPQYRIDYSGHETGIFEESLKNLSSNKEYRQMSIHEASRYPPLYYFLISLNYRLFYGRDLIIRVFVARLFQLIFYMGVVLLAYLTAKNIFESVLQQTTAVMLVAFHPMFSFVSAGINSDNAGNLIFSVFTYISVITLKKGINLKRLIALILTLILSGNIKPQFIVILPLIFVLLIIAFLIKKRQNSINPGRILFTAVVFIISIMLLWRSGRDLFSIIFRFFSHFDVNLVTGHIKNYALPHLYHEVMPWYWGIFNWLGVTYIRPVHRLVNWISLTAIIGLSIYFLKNVRKKIYWPVSGFFYLVFCNLLLFSGIYLYDWLETVRTKYHLGVQGRYFFPLLVSQMILIFQGFRALFSFTASLKSCLVKLLAVLMVIFHWYALLVVSASYYDLSSIRMFIVQASQYKPWFFKGGFLFSLIALAMSVNLVFLLQYLKEPENYGTAKKEKS